MARADKTEVYDVPVEKFYQAIIDYKKYPEFVDGCKTLVVEKESAEGAIVKFTLSIIKEIAYTLNLKHIPNKEVSWTLVTGDMMKINNGKWTLKDLGNGKTEVNYNLEIEFKGFLPGLGLIEKTLVNTNLPMTMKAFCKRAQGL
jgi:coenzyme Q-binding protein COQ10